MAPNGTIRFDLCAQGCLEALLGHYGAADDVWLPSELADMACDYAVALLVELKRRNPLTGEPLYPHGALPVDQDAGEPAAVEAAR